MKYIPIAVLLLIMNLSTAFCPTLPILYIPESPVIKVTPKSAIAYNELIDAVFTLESARDTMAYNPDEQATGGLQVTPGLLDEYNKLTDNSYTLNDMYDFEISKKIFMYYTTHDHNGKTVEKSMERIADDWNGDRTGKYWGKIQNIMESRQ